MSIGTSRQALTNDSDGDGVADSSDNCPRVPNATQANTNGIGPGDACELSLVFLTGTGTNFVRFQSAKELMVTSAPFTLSGTPDLLRVRALPSGAVPHQHGGRARLGVQSPGENGNGDADTIAGSEKLVLEIGQDAVLGGAQASEVHLHLDGTATVVVSLWNGSTLVSSSTAATNGVRWVRYAAASGAPFDRVEISTTSGKLGLKGPSDAVMFGVTEPVTTCPAGYQRVGNSCVDIDECVGLSALCDPRTTCTNTPGSYACGPCPAGYRGTGATGCIDIDECTEGTDTCSELVSCSNTAGSYICGDCPAGYRGDGHSCADIDECAEQLDACDPLVTCTNTVGTYTCGACPSGYAGAGDTGCTDIDECARPEPACDALTTCTNQPGSFECGPCPSGYTGDGVAGCLDIDECTLGTAACSPLVVCGNTPGSYQCGACPAGYEGDGHECYDVDECARGTDSCSDLVECVNHVGGYTCGACPNGYTGDGTTCSDVDECATAPCDVHTSCTNTTGAYTCGDCPSGYTGDGYAGCVDIDECAQHTDTCSPLVTCGNTDGGYQCSPCPAGYSGDGHTCSDVDECAFGTDDCSEVVTCTNSEGGYVCGECPAGYLGDGYSCTDRDECAESPCDPLTACTNTAGSFLCSDCPAGYTGTGFAGCLDIDECAVDNGGCEPSEACVNTHGSRDCVGCGDTVGVGSATQCGQGRCAAQGTVECVHGVPTDTCVPGLPAADDALCNGVDDDCDGPIDEDFQGTSVSCGIGACTSAGSSICSGGVVTTSGCIPGQPTSDDASCNGVDDDCDGLTDEDFAPQPASCGAGACAATGTESCSAGHVVLHCVPGQPASADISCDGVDNDCNGLIDDGYVPVPTSCVQQGCIGNGTMACIGGALVDTCLHDFPCGIETDCSDAQDNDADGNSDCRDADCQNAPACAEDCDNGRDDDLDGFTDCYDDTCSTRVPCIPEICGNGMDDDGDLHPDCTATDCEQHPDCPSTPTDPSTVAPALPNALVLSVLDRWGFLVEGTEPIQQGITTRLDHKRTSMISACVTDRNGVGIPRVRMAVGDRPELGFTYTRADGCADLLVLSAGALRVELTAQGLLPVHRIVEVGWNQFASLPPVVMLPLDSAVTQVDFSGASPITQVARGANTDDERGHREITVLIPGGVTAEMVFADGSTSPLSIGSIRATEYTIGPNGPNAMPAALPTNTAYTYAVDLTVDEALAAGAKTVRFSSPLAVYLDNFLQLPTGTGLPLGYYDADCGCWVPEPNGRVLSIVGETGNSAQLDVNGDGREDSGADLTSLGITPFELNKLAELFEPGTSLWRIRVPHFSPYDINAFLRALQDPNLPIEDQEEDTTKQVTETDTCKEGSIISCGSGSLAEQILLPGIPYPLVYASMKEKRVGSGRYPDRISIPITSATVSPRLLGATVDVHLGDVHTTSTFGPEPNRQMTVEWPDEDRLGRPNDPDGIVIAQIRVCWTHSMPREWPVVELWNGFGFGSLLGSIGSSVDTYALTDATVITCRHYSRSLQKPLSTSVVESGSWELAPLLEYNPYNNTVRHPDGTVEAPKDLPNITPVPLHFGLADGSEAFTRSWMSVVTVLPDGTTVLRNELTKTLESAFPGETRKIGADIKVVSGKTGIVVAPSITSIDACIKEYVTNDCGTGEHANEPFFNPALSPSFEQCARCTAAALGPPLATRDAFAEDGTYVYVNTKQYNMVRYRVERAETSAGPRLRFVDGTFVLGRLRTGSTATTPPSAATDLNAQTAATVNFADLTGASGGSSGSSTYYYKYPPSIIASRDGSFFVAAHGGLFSVVLPGAVWRVKSDGVAERLATTVMNSQMDVIRGPNASVFVRTVTNANEGFGCPPNNLCQTWFWASSDGQVRHLYTILPGNSREGLIGNGGFESRYDFCAIGNTVVAGPCASALGAFYDVTTDRLIVQRTGDKTTVFASVDYQLLADEGGTVFPYSGTGLYGTDQALFRIPMQFEMYPPMADKQWPGWGLTMPWTLTPDGTIRTFSAAPSAPYYATSYETIAVAGFGSLVDLDHRASSSALGRLVMNRQGVIEKIIDPITWSPIVEFERDMQERVVALRDANGNVTTIERNADGVPVAYEGPLGHRSEIALDGRNRVIAITDPMQNAWHATYISDTGRLASLTDPEGKTSTFTYDALGRLASDRNAEGGLQTLAFQTLPTGFKSTHTDADNVKTLVENSEATGLVFTTTYPDGTKVQKFESSDTITESTILRDNTLFTSQMRNSATEPQRRSAWNRGGVGIGGAIGQTTTSVATFAPDGRPMRVESTLRSADRRWLTTYDAATRKKTFRTPLGKTSSATFDEAGNMIESQQAGELPVTYERDSRGRVVRIAQGARVVTVDYDANGAVERFVDASQRTTEMSSDLNGRVLTVTDAAGQLLKFRYNRVSHLVGVAPPGRPEHSFELTSYGALRKYVSPVGPSDMATYSLGHRVASYAAGNGKSFSVTRDSSGRVATLTTSSGSYQFSYVSGMLRQVSAPSGNTFAQTYSNLLFELPATLFWSTTPALGNTGPTGTVTREFQDYNTRLLTSALKVIGIPVKYTYDADALVSSVAIGTSSSATLPTQLILSRDPSSGKVLATSFGASTSSYSFSNYGEFASHGVAQSGVNLFQTSVARDVGGLSNTEDEVVGGSQLRRTFEYDGAGRLVKVTTPAGSTTYVYDQNGNRLSRSGLSGVEIGSYDEGDRVLAYGIYAYEHDGAGFRTAKTGITDGARTTYEYDLMGALTRVVGPNGSVISYEIDPTGRRVGKRVNNTVTKRWLYQDGLRLAAELSPTNTIVSQFVYAERVNVPTLMRQGSTVYRIVSDHRGSVRLVVNVSTGVVAQRIDYDEFGRVLNDTNPGFQPFGFAGGLYDPDTGLVRFGARDYDAYTGRWMARDPILFGGGDSNLYAYVANDPVNLIDPSGHLGMLATGAIGAGIGFVAGGLGAVSQGQSFWGGAVGGAASGFLIGSGGALVLALTEGGGVVGAGLAAYLAAGNGVVSTVIGQGVQQWWDYMMRPTSACGDSKFEFKPNGKAALASGLLAGATLGIGAIVGAGAAQLGTAAEVAAEASWGWATSSLDMAAGAYFSE